MAAITTDGHPLPYHFVLRRQLAVDCEMMIEVYREHRGALDQDVEHFDALFQKLHMAQRAEMMSVAERERDLLIQKIGNLQAEAQRLEAQVAAARRDLPAEEHGANGHPSR